MKIKFLPALAILLTAAGITTSCLDSEVTEVSYSSETSIRSFSLGTLKVKGKTAAGKDTIYTADMSGYPFTIDQSTREIENKDSLPVGTIIDKVLTNVNADTPYIQYKKKTQAGEAGKDTVWTSTDSIDFTYAPIEFQVVSYSGLKGMPYKIKINVHEQDPDSLSWSKLFDTHRFSSGTFSRQKAFSLGDKIFVLGEQGGQAMAEYTTVRYTEAQGVAVQAEPSAWTAVELPEGTDIYSAISWQGKICFLANNEPYVLSPEDGTCGKAQAGEDSPRLTKLIAGTSTGILYAQGETSFATWEKGTWNSEAPIAQFPYDKMKESSLSAASLPVSYNNELERVVVLGNNPAKADTTAIICTRLSNDDSWMVYQQQKDTCACPNIVDPTMIYYDKKLYAFGGEIKTSSYKFEPFGIFFSSKDNGLTWKPVKRHLSFPTGEESFANRYERGGKSYSCAVDRHSFIWIIWNDGTMNRGRVNHLGFMPKWE